MAHSVAEKENPSLDFSACRRGAREREYSISRTAERAKGELFQRLREVVAKEGIQLEVFRLRTARFFTSLLLFCLFPVLTVGCL